METRVIQIDQDADLASATQHAVDVVNAGGLVAFPTETVYGVGVRADIAEAVVRLRELKSRTSGEPFTVHVGAPKDVDGFAPSISGVGKRFIRKTWPGPLTLIVSVDDPESVPRMKGLDRAAISTMYYENTIGLRCPDDVVARGLLTAVKGPVVAASANRSARPAPRTAGEALAELGGQIDLLIDTGRTRYAKCSTIVRLNDSGYEVVREGVYDARIVGSFAMFRILFVCTGNTCRSPMAAGLARTLLAKRVGCTEFDLGSHNVEVLSAGTIGGSGGPAQQAVAIMQRRGTDISGHVSCQLTAEMIRESDEILVMTEAHRQTVLGMVPSAADRAHLLLEDRDIRDPIGGTEEDYEDCARGLEEGLLTRLDKVVL